MMIPILGTALLGVVLLGDTAIALNSQLVGTWSSKSAKVLTGPGFYNPVNDSFIEPSHTGVSYSFTADGFYEEAYYRAISNPTTPSCPQAILQFQHGTVTESSSGSLLLAPFSVDGRQLLSDPCEGSIAPYTRYNQTETMKKYVVSIDGYKKVRRLDLYQFDGTPLQPLYLAYSQPLMLPTVTMNPTASATAAAATGKVKRSLVEGVELPLNKDAKHVKRTAVVDNRQAWERLDDRLIWWIGLGMTVIGGTAYLL